MPTYDYQCDECGHKFELFQNFSDIVKRKCPSCGRMRLRRLIGAGCGVIFKGSGFYETDYKRAKSAGRPSAGDKKHGRGTTPAPTQAE